MKMLCSASDFSLFERLVKRLLSAGIRCGVETKSPTRATSEVPDYPELWIQNESDVSKAVRLLTACISRRRD